MLLTVKRINKTKNTNRIIVAALEELKLFRICEMLVPD